MNNNDSTLRTNYSKLRPELPDGQKPVPLGSGIVRSILGEGGTAVVYEIWNERLGVKRAVKVAKPNSSPDSIERFHRETKILAQLNHPNIINVHSVGQWESLPYIEMDMVEGSSLETVIEENGPLPISVVLAIAIEVGKALDYTHSHRYKIHNVEYQGLLHRDLKPANILLPRNDTVRLTDFGIASLSTTASTGISKTGTITGSMQYLAPEQLEDNVVDVRSDIFSFGCVLYEMLTGDKVFAEQNIGKLVKKRIQNIYEPLKSYKLKVPQPLIDLVEDCLSKKAVGRPESMKVILSQLESLYPLTTHQRSEELLQHFLNGGDVDDKKLSRRERSRGGKKKANIILFLGFLAGFILFLLLISGGAYWYMRYYKPDIWNRLTAPDYVTHEYSKGIVIRSEEIEKSRTAKPKIKIKRIATPKRVVAKSKNTPEESLLSKQFARFETDDTLEALLRVYYGSDYGLLATLIDNLEPSQKAQKEVRLLQHRSNLALGLESRVYYENNHIGDGEFYLSKGKYLYSQGRYQRAVWILKVATATPCALKNEEEVKQEAFYYIALSQDGAYKMKQSEQGREKLIAAWQAVIEQYPSGTSNGFISRARREIDLLMKAEDSGN